MAEYPCLPLFTDAFIADTIHLSAAQTGGYLMLLMCAWRSPDCTIPNNDRILARFCRMSAREWKANKDVILSFWDEKGNTFSQKRLLDERNYVRVKRDLAAHAGRASALKRKKRHSTDVAPTLERNANGNPTPTPTPTPSINKYFDDFNTFWKQYPDHGPDGLKGSGYKGSKKSAKDKFLTIAKKEKNYEEFIANLTQGNEKYREFLNKNPRQQSKHAATWINQKCWEDDYSISSTPQTQNGRGSSNNIEASVRQALSDTTRNTAGQKQILRNLGLDND